MGFSIAEIAAALGGRAVGDTDLTVERVVEPGTVDPDGLSLALNPKYGEALAELAAPPTPAAVLWGDADWAAYGLRAAILVDDTRLVMADTTRLFDPGPEIAPGIHASAIIEPGAEIGQGAAIGPFVYIGVGARIGAGARIGPQVYVGEHAEIGPDALLLAGVKIMHRVRIGARFIAHPGAVIGADGFSYVSPETMNIAEMRRTLDTGEAHTEGGDATWTRVHSLGWVEIGDDVEVGANSCIDRGTIRATSVGRGTKIDNLVQLGHNAVIGEDCMLCSMSGVAGSSQLGDRVVLGGKAAVNDNIKINDDVIVAGAARVYTNVPKGRVIMGSPAVKMDTNMEIIKATRRLPRILRDVQALQKAVSKLTPDD